MQELFHFYRIFFCKGVKRNAFVEIVAVKPKKYLTGQTYKEKQI